MKKQLWVIRDESGRIQGPYSTETVLNKIAKGGLTGDEFIAAYPGSDWIPISQEARFYDQLLSVLAEGTDDLLSRDQPASSAAPSSTLDQDTIPPDVDTTQPAPKEAPPAVEPPTAAAPAEEFEYTYKTVYVDEEQAARIDRGEEIEVEAVEPSPEEPRRTQTTSARSRSARTRGNNKSSRRPRDIELRAEENIALRLKMKAALWPVLVVGIVVVLVATWLLWPTKKTRGIVALKLPSVDQAPLEAKEAQRLYDRALDLFNQDRFDGYRSAQNDLVRALESSSESPEAWALLCMTYYQLWPFANQGNSDFIVLREAARRSLRVDPSGRHSAVCRIVNSMLRGDDTEARSLADSVLDSFQSNQQPPLFTYYLKAQQLFDAQNRQTAIGYARTVTNLWPAWIGGHMLHAQLLARDNRPNEAATIYREVLEADAGHTGARIEMGLIQLRVFNRQQEAYDNLLSAIQSKRETSNVIAAKAFLALAEIALRASNNAEALRFAQRAFATNPADPAAKNLAQQLGGLEATDKLRVDTRQLIAEGDQFAREMNLEAALVNYKAAFKEDPRNAVAALKAARVSWALSFVADATDWLERAIRADPRFMESYITLADYYAQRFDFQNAIAVLQNADQISPENHEVYRGFAIVELRRQNPKSALAFAEKAIKFFADSDSFVVGSRAYTLLRDWEKAFRSAARAVELDPNNREAQIAYAKAMVHFETPDAAITYLNKMVQNFPLLVELQVALGEVMLEDERYRDAEQVFRRSIEINRRSIPAYMGLAKALKNQQKSNEALAALRAAAVINPADSRILFEQGILYLELAKPAEARSAFQSVLKQNPKYPLVHYQMGRASLLMGNFREALNEAQEEQRVNPRLGEAYFLAAEARAKSGQWKACVQEYQRALQAAPTQGAQVHVKMAQCCIEANNLDCADQSLAKAKNLESGLAEIYRELGRVFEKRGQVDKAVESYQLYVELSPNAMDRDMIIGRIMQLRSGGF